MRLFFLTLVFCLMWVSLTPLHAASEFASPWRMKNSSIVIDAYEYTPINWLELKKNKRLVGFINKASDGLSPKYSCKRGDKYCRLAWRRNG